MRSPLSVTIAAILPVQPSPEIVPFPHRSRPDRNARTVGRRRSGKLIEEIKTRETGRASPVPQPTLPPPLTQTPRAIARPGAALITFPSFRRPKIRCKRGLDFCLRTKNRRQPLDAGVCFPATAVTTLVTAKSRSGDDTGRRQMLPRRRHWSSQFATAATLQIAAIEIAATLQVVAFEAAATQYRRYRDCGRRLRRPRNSKRPSESRPARFTTARHRWTSRDT